MSGNQVDSVGDHGPALDVHLGAKSAEALQMLVNGPAADVAAPGKGHLGALVLAQQSSDEIIGCADPADVLVIHRHLFNIAAVDPHRVAVDPLHPGSDLLNRLQKHVDISHVRKIVNQHIVICHYGRRKNPQRGILGSAYGHIAHQRIPAFDHILFHRYTSILNYPIRPKVPHRLPGSRQIVW